MKPEARHHLRRPALFRFAAMGILLLLPAGLLRAGDPPVLKCTPQELHGVPGEPLQASLTAESRSAVPVVFRIPEAPLLSLRTVEKVPLRTAQGKTMVQERIVIWQGLEPGTVTLDNLTAEIDGKRFTFPPLKITIDPVSGEK